MEKPKNLNDICVHKIKALNSLVNIGQLENCRNCELTYDSKDKCPYNRYKSYQESNMQLPIRKGKLAYLLNGGSG